MARQDHAEVAPVAEGDEYQEIDSGRLPDEGKEAVQAVANGSKDPDHLTDATAWFLSDEDANVKAERTFELNVSADEDHERFVVWRVQAIARERIRQIRNQSRVKGRRGFDAEMNETKANLLIAAEGTIEPDLRVIAGQIGATSPEQVLERRMAHKPGLIDQIAGQVLSASGYDEDDVRDVAQGKH